MDRRVGVAIVVALIALRSAALVFLLDRLPPVVDGHYVANDALRYQEIAVTPGTPYRDFEVEVPPAEYFFLKAFHGADPRSTAVDLAWVQLALDLVVVGGLALGWGRNATIAYLLVSLPLIPFLYFRLDLLSMALAVWAMALVRRRAALAGGAALAAALFAKFWPAVLAVPLAARSRWKALAAFAACTAAGFAAWILWAGVQGPREVATFRGAHGWQIESTVGSVLLRFGHLPVVWDQGANRIGYASPGARAAMSVALLAGLIGIGLLVRRRADELTGTGAVASISLLLLASPILSWQYVAWLTPWAAIAWMERERAVTVVTLAVTALTAPLVPLGVELTERGDLAVGILLLRNGALVALLAVCVLRLSINGNAARWETGSHEPEPAGV